MTIAGHKEIVGGVRSLNTIGTLSYNGYVFDGAISIDVSETRVRDEAARTVIYCLIRITVRAIVASPGGSTASASSAMSDLRDIRNKLSEDGRILILRNSGFGDDLIVNRDAVRDVKWGPKTQELQWRPVGGNLAAEVTWTVETAIPECETPGARSFAGIMALNYEAQYQITQSGATQRVISGYLEIAQTRLTGTRMLPDSADGYRERISPTPPDGFARQQTWNIDKSKSRLDFTIIDTEIESDSFYPPGVVNIQGMHNADWSRPNGKGLNYRNRLVMTMTFAKGANRTRGYLFFLQTFEQLRRAAKTYSNLKALFLDTLSIEEELFGRSVSFALSYRLLVTDVKDMVRQCGFFEVISPSNAYGSRDWKVWRTSLSGSMFGNRGVAGLSNSPGDDAIVDLCLANPTMPGGSENEPSPSPRFPSILENEQPDAKSSWLSWHAAIRPTIHNPTSRHSVMQGPPANEAENLLAEQTGTFRAGSLGDAGVADPIISRGRPIYGAHFIGMASRVGFQIERPVLLKIGEQDAVEQWARFVCEPKGNKFGQPVFHAKWNIYYVLAGPIGDTADTLKKIRPIPEL